MGQGVPGGCLGNQVGNPAELGAGHILADPGVDLGVGHRLGTRVDILDSLEGIVEVPQEVQGTQAVSVSQGVGELGDARAVGLQVPLVLVEETSLVGNPGGTVAAPA